MEGNEENNNDEISEKAAKEIKKKEYLRNRMLKKGKSGQSENERVPPGQHLSKKYFFKN